MEDSAAFDQSLDELGDVDELLDYLKGLDPEEELPRLTLHPYEEQEKAKRDLDDLLSSVDEIVENAMDQAKDALRQARDAARQVRKSSWRSDDGSLEFHFNEPADKQDRRRLRTPPPPAAARSRPTARTTARAGTCPSTIPTPQARKAGSSPLDMIKRRAASSLKAAPPSTLQAAPFPLRA